MGDGILRRLRPSKLGENTGWPAEIRVDGSLPTRISLFDLDFSWPIIKEDDLIYAKPTRLDGIGRFVWKLCVRFACEPVGSELPVSIVVGVIF